MATGTLQDLLNSGMSPEEINALLSQSTVGTTGFNPLGTMGDEPYVPPEPGYGPAGMVEQAPLNTIRNNSTGRVFSPTGMNGQPSQSQGVAGASGMSGLPLDYSQSSVKTPYGTGQYLKGDSTRMMITDGPQFGKIVDLGRDTGAERARTKENLALDAQRATIAHTQAQTAATLAKPVEPGTWSAVESAGKQYIINNKTGQIKPAEVSGQQLAGKKDNSPAEKAKADGLESLNSIIDGLRASYDTLDTAKAIPSTERGGLSNIGASSQASGIGQFTGRILGTKEQAVRDEVQSQRLLLLNAIKQATGMSAQQMNSNVELKTWLDAVTNPSRSVQANRQILDNIQEFVTKKSGGASSSAGKTVVREVQLKDGRTGVEYSDGTRGFK